MSSQSPSKKLTHTIHMLDQLNTQIGIAGALVVEQYHQLRQQVPPPPPPGYYPPQYPPQTYGQPPAPYPPGYYPPQYPPQPTTQPYPAPAPQPQQPPQQPTPGIQQSDPNQPQVPPIAQDFASLSNILTQIQYDLFDINVTLAQTDFPEQLDTRIDDKAITWISDIINKISSQLPAHQDPILPIGNAIATNFYLAKNIAQQALSALESIPEVEQKISDHQVQLHRDYLTQLQAFMFTCFRWANLILKERDWYWKPKSQMQQESTTQENATTQPATPQPNTQTVYTNQPSYQTPQDKPDSVVKN